MIYFLFNVTTADQVCGLPHNTHLLHLLLLTGKACLIQSSITSDMSDNLDVKGLLTKPKIPPILLDLNLKI